MSLSASTFFSADANVFEREIQIEGNIINKTDIWNEKQCQIALAWLRSNNYKKICLQFPDEYLSHSNNICTYLESQLPLDTKVFILADTSYGSCCVDEIAAEHVSSDCIIHFGNACRSKVTRLPVLYLFPQLDFNMPKFFAQLETTFGDKCADKAVIIYFDIGYHHLLEHDDSVDENNFLVKIKKALLHKSLQVTVFPTAYNEKLEENDDAIGIFVGCDNNNFFQLSLTTLAANWYIYDVNSCTLSEKNPLTTNYIRRRYYYIEKCKDARFLGLIVATLSADGYLDVITHLQQMAKSRGIRTQIISVGRINPAKLANFLEIDCFVLIGCPFNNLYNNRDYFKPIVSVFEAEMALNPAWHTRYPEHYVTDFKQLLPEGRSFLPFNSEDLAEHDVSLISGTVRNTATSNAQQLEGDITSLTEAQRKIIPPRKMELMTSNTGLTLQDRTWRGLEQALGQTDPAKVQKGLSGIPISYTQ